MLNRNCKITLPVLLILPMLSFGQAGVIYETSLQSNIISNNQVGVTARTSVISQGYMQTDKFSSEMSAGIVPSQRHTEPVNNNEKTFPKNIISLKMGIDDPWAGLAYERLLSKYLGTEAQIGLLGASLGVKIYYPAIRNGRVNFHVGVLPGWGFRGGLKTYFPIGINVLTKKNFRFSLDAGPRIWHGNGEENLLGVSLKIGKGF